MPEIWRRRLAYSGLLFCGNISGLFNVGVILQIQMLLKNINFNDMIISYDNIISFL